MSTLAHTNKVTFYQFLKQTQSLPTALIEYTNLDNFSDKNLYDHLIDNKIFNERHLNNLKKYYQMTPFFDLKSYTLSNDLVTKIPAPLAYEHQVILLRNNDSSFSLGMKNPLDYESIHFFSDYLQCYLTKNLVDELALIRAHAFYYRQTQAIDTLTANLEQSLSSFEGVDNNKQDHLLTEENKNYYLLKIILKDACRLNASDVHIETDDDVFRIRIRIDGVLQEQIIKRPMVGKQLIRIIKLLAGLDITDSNMPEDATFEIKIDNKLIRTRLSILPIEKGQSAVIRIIDREFNFNQLTGVRLDKQTATLINQFLHKKEGMLLITGPTGSGKTTTLYSALNKINSETVKIITIEEPVEQFIPRINQIEINTDLDLDYAKALKACLRQDPDIILVGEIRDQETANIATRAAITGHKVLSTLHTTDTISTISRLSNLNVPNYLLATALDCIIAQRLVKNICSNCSTEHKLNTQEIKQIHSILDENITDAQYTFKIGAGCSFCQNTGYMGRSSIQEILVITNPMREFMHANNFLDLQLHAKQQLVKKTLQYQAYNLAKQGIISLNEVFSLSR